MENSVYIDEHGVIFNVYVGNQDYNSIVDVIEQTEALIQNLGAGAEVYILADILRLERLGHGTRQAVARAMKIPFRRLAIFGASTYQEKIINLMMQAFGRGDHTMMFHDRDKAKAWLREGNTTPKA